MRVELHLLCKSLRHCFLHVQSISVMQLEIPWLEAKKRKCLLARLVFLVQIQLNMYQQRSSETLSISVKTLQVILHFQRKLAVPQLSLQISSCEVTSRLPLSKKQENMQPHFHVAIKELLI